MIPIDEYIKLPREERCSHLSLAEACDERGGYSTQYKGLLAHHLGTSIPKGLIALVCHACNNAKCSNPRHLYWGTQSDNKNDSYANGEKTIWQKMVEKYGDYAAREIQRRTDTSKAGKGNKGKPKSEAHKKKISDAIRKRHYGGRDGTVDMPGCEPGS